MEGSAWDAAMERVWAVLKWRPDKAKPGAGAGALRQTSDRADGSDRPDESDTAAAAPAAPAAPARPNTILTIA